MKRPRIPLRDQIQQLKQEMGQLEEVLASRDREIKNQEETIQILGGAIQWKETMEKHEKMWQESERRLNTRISHLQREFEELTNALVRRLQRDNAELSRTRQSH